MIALPQASSPKKRNGQQSLRMSSSFSLTISAMRTCPAMAALILKLRISTASPHKECVFCRATPIRRVFGHTHRADHRPLPVSAATRFGRASSRQPDVGLPRTPDLALAVEEGWLQLDLGRQMAFGRSAEVWSSQEWVRSFLRISRRSGGLLFPRIRRDRKIFGMMTFRYIKRAT